MSASSSPKRKQGENSAFSGTLSTMSLPLNTLSSLLTMQDVEDHKPRLSKISWLPDILVYSGSIMPTVLGPVLVVTAFSAVVAAVSLYWGKEVGLSNNVVPLLSVVVGLLLVFRNSSAYERYAEGRKDFTSLISNARNLSRLIWITITLPPVADGTTTISRQQLTLQKKQLIRLIVAFVVATKHHLRAEGGVHHDDLRGLLPSRLAGSNLKHLKVASSPEQDRQAERLLTQSPDSLSKSRPRSPRPDEEASLGMAPSSSGLYTSPSALSAHERHSTFGRPKSSQSLRSQLSDIVSAPGSALHRRRHDKERPGVLKRRPTAVRVLVPDELLSSDGEGQYGLGLGHQHGHAHAHRHREKLKDRISERTPLIKAGVKPDLRKSGDEGDSGTKLMKRAEAGLGRMVELGLPLIIAHDISRTLFRFRRMGFLESVGPAVTKAGVNAMQALVNSMTDQLGSMERVVQTPMPYIIAVHMKQATTMLLFVLPFVLVDTLQAKMVPLMFFIALIYMGIEGIAAQVEQPFGTDPCDLNLDLYCTELLCECEAILERLPEGQDDDDALYERSAEQLALDLAADDGDDGDGGE